MGQVENRWWTSVQGKRVAREWCGRGTGSTLERGSADVIFLRIGRRRRRRSDSTSLVRRAEMSCEGVAHAHFVTVRREAAPVAGPGGCGGAPSTGLAAPRQLMTPPTGASAFPDGHGAQTLGSAVCWCSRLLHECPWMLAWADARQAQQAFAERQRPSG